MRRSQAPDPYAADIAGLDSLDVPVAPAPSLSRRAWSSTWPVLAAITLALSAWQVVAWVDIKPDDSLPGPGPVLSRLWEDRGVLLEATILTMRRAAVGYSLALVIGSAFGLLVSRIRVVRAAIGSLIIGLQTMPTIAWFPLAILLLGPNESAIQFVVVLSGAPAIASGLISGVDHIPPLLLRAGHVLGARGIAAYRHVILPAALPGYVAGLKQGWAFAWRGLMAGEIVVVIGSRLSLGSQLQSARDMKDAERLIGGMIVILLIGVLVDAFGFARADAAIRRRWGLGTE
jgi:NitT/TauT family transport system permease protein